MARPQELNTTTVRIQLPDNFLKSLKASKDKSDPGVDVSISDIENPVYRELLNNVYDAVIIADSTGNIQDFNHTANKKIHVPSSNMIKIGMLVQKIEKISFDGTLIKKRNS